MLNNLSLQQSCCYLCLCRLRWWFLVALGKLIQLTKVCNFLLLIGMVTLVCPDDLHSISLRSVSWEPGLYGLYHLGSLSFCLPAVFGHWETQTAEIKAGREKTQVIYFPHALPPWLYSKEMDKFFHSLSSCSATAISWFQISLDSNNYHSIFFPFRSRGSFELVVPPSTVVSPNLFHIC